MTSMIDSEPLDQDFTEFLQGKKKNTAQTYRSALALWINYSHMNGSESLEFKRKDSTGKTEKLVMGFQKYLLGLGKSENTAKTLCGAIRGFFTDNRMSLQFKRGESKNLSEANRVTTDYLFTKEDLAKMSEQGNLTEKYILLVGKSVGLRASDFLSFTYGTFRGIHLESEAPVGLGEIFTVKEKVRAYPFLDTDAVSIIKAMLERSPEAKNSEKILKIDEESLTEALKRMISKSHIEIGSKVVRFHNLRKYLIDRLSSVASESQWKQIVGKSISEGAYVSQDQLREVYARAMPIITINGNHTSSVKLEALESEVKELRAKNLFYEEILKKLVSDKVSSDIKTIKVNGEDVATLPVKGSIWTEYLEKLGEKK